MQRCVLISTRCARRAGDPLRDQAPCPVDDACTVTFVRTNQTRSRGVSDPLQADLRAKSGAAETGSLTPRLPPSSTSPTAAGFSRGKRRRALSVSQRLFYQRHAASKSLCSLNSLLRHGASPADREGERCSRVSVPPPRSRVHGTHAEPTREERCWYPWASVAVVTRPRPLASASSRTGDTVPWRRRLPSLFQSR